MKVASVGWQVYIFTLLILPFSSRLVYLLISFPLCILIIIFFFSFNYHAFLCHSNLLWFSSATCRTYVYTITIFIYYLFTYWQSHLPVDALNVVIHDGGEEQRGPSLSGIRCSQLISVSIIDAGRIFDSHLFLTSTTVCLGTTGRGDYRPIPQL